MKRLQDPELKLLLALYQVDGVLKLIEGNEYETYMKSSLSRVHYELIRQLKNLKHKKDNEPQVL